MILIHPRQYRQLARAAALTLGLAGLLLTGCKTGPDYVRPTVETPEAWRWKLAEPRDHVPRGAWWEVFGDPELNRLEALAIADNLDLRAAFGRVEQARLAARLTESQFYPTIDGQAGWVRYRTSGSAPAPVPFPVPSMQQSQWSIPLDLSYELDLWGKVRRDFEAARYRAQGSEAARQAVLLALQAEVAAAYFSLQTAGQQQDLLKQTIALRSEALGLFEQRLAAGIGGDFEVQRARVEVATAEADLAAVERGAAQLQHLLAVLCGRPPSALEFTVTPGPPRLPQIQPDVPSSVLERRPDVAQAERELAARCAQIGVAKASFFPVVRLTASGGFLSGDLEDLFNWDSRTWSIGPGLSVPLFAGGRLRAGLERSRAAYEEAVSLYRQQVLVAFKEVEDSLSALSHLARESTARQTAAEAAEAARRIAFDRYRAGSVNFLEVVDAEQARLLNELAHLRVGNEQQLATVRLIKALGGGWE
jgi:multidrug efflux system outer membrane protein